MAAAFASALLVLGLGAAPAYSACTGSTWSLAASGNWNAAGNWTPSGVPNSSGTNVCIVDGSSAVSLTNLSPTVDDLTLASGNALDISTGLSLGVAGTSISNAGAITLNGGAGADGLLNIGNNVALSGGGTLTMSVAGGGGNAFIEQSGGSFALTNADNTIQGDGTIGNGGLTLSNAATIDANVSGGTLQLNGTGNVTNTGLLEATSGGTLEINNTVNNAGGNITAHGGTVNMQGATVQGGTLNTTGGGTMETVGSATLDGVTISTGSTYTASNNATTALLGTITNNGTIQLNGGSGANGLLDIAGNVTLQGGGIVTMSVASGGGNAFIEQSGGSFTLTNVNNTIQGDGAIGNGGLTLVNQASGIIDANSAGSPLTLNGSGGITNAGLMKATGSGVLQIQSVVTNTGNITASGGSATVQVSNTITGGTLNTTGGGTMDTVSSATLNGVTISSGSTYTASNNATTALLGTITNNGTIQLNGGSGANGLLNIAGNVTLQGGGIVNMSVAGGGGNAFIQQSGGSFTLTNVNNTIQGDGVIGNGGLTLSNAATIDANVSGGTLQLNGSGNVTNTGLLEATSGGTLEINNTVNNKGGNITANGGTVAMQGATVQGGTLNTTGGGTMETVGSATLDGSTASGAVTISSGSTYTASNNATTALLGTITNKGTIQLNGGSGANGLLNIDGNVTLSGGGTLNMSVASGGGNAFIQQSGGSFTLTNADNAIQGDGVIGNGGLTVVNGASGTLLANVSGQTLLVNGSGSLTNNGTFEATAGSTLHTTGGTFTNFSGTTLTGGTYDANGTIEIDELGSTGGEIVTNNANIILNGASSGAAAILDSAGKNALSALATNQGSFTIENGGNANFTTAGDLTNSGTVTVGGGTTLKLGSGGASSYAQSAGTTQGTGTIAGVVAINGGTILPGGPNSPGTLNITGTYTQTGGSFDELISNSGNSLLNVSGAASLSGAAALSINQLSGFNPTVGTTYTLLNASSVGGTFSNTLALEDTAFNSGTEDWQVIYKPSSVVIQADSTLVTATWAPPSPSGTNGHWTTASEWTCTATPTACMPNNNGIFTFNAVLNSTGQVLTLDSADSPAAITVNDLTVTAGTLAIGAGGSLTANGTALNNGTIAVTNGTLNGNNGLTNNGTLSMNGTTGGTVAVTGAFTNGSAATVGLSGSNDTLSAASFSNAGSVSVGGGESLNVTNGYAQSAGSTTVNGALSAASVGINGGTLYGTGTVKGVTTIASGAFLQPGSPSSTGTLNINGSLAINGTLNEVITSSGFDALNISGTPGSLTLGSGSSLDILLASGYNPVAGTSFTIADYSSLSGTFGSITNDTFNSGAEEWNVAYNAGDIVLTAANVVTPPTTVTATWNTPSGNWTTATEWSCTPGPATCVPSNGTPTNTNYAAITNSAGNTLTLNTTESINTLALTAGTLDIASGGSLNLANQPGGITDIASGAGLSLEGSFTAGSSSALAGLASAEGTLTLDNGQTTNDTPGSGALTVSTTGSVSVSASSTILSVTGGVSNSGAVTVLSEGLLAASGNYAQTSGTTTINGGLLGAGGALTNDGASKFNIQNGGGVKAASVDNFGSIITGNAVGDSGNNLLVVAGPFRNEVSATLSLETGGDSVAMPSGDFTNLGTVSLAEGTALTSNMYTQISGTTTVGGTLTTSPYDQKGGTTTIAVGGTLNGSVSYSQGSGVTDVNGTLITPTVGITGGTLKG